MGTGHFARDCKNKPRCNGCNKERHRAATCPDKAIGHPTELRWRAGDPTKVLHTRVMEADDETWMPEKQDGFGVMFTVAGSCVGERGSVCWALSDCGAARTVAGVKWYAE